MITIVAGCRYNGIEKHHVAEAYEKCPWPITHVFSGKAIGADTWGEEIADEKGIPVTPFPVSKEEWEVTDEAGKLRNVDMAVKAEALLAIWDAHSGGTQHMIDVALNMGLPTCVYYYKLGQCVTYNWPPPPKQLDLELGSGQNHMRTRRNLYNDLHS